MSQPPTHSSFAPIQALQAAFARATATTTRTVLFACACALLVTICGCCGLSGVSALVGSASPNGPATTRSTTSPAPTATLSPTLAVTAIPQTPTATPRPQPTATLAPQPVSGPILGGSVDDFTSAYGTPDQGTTGWSDVTVAGQEVSLTISGPGPSGATDGQDRAAAIDLSPAIPAASWTLAQGNAMMATFFPPDARYQKTISTSNGPEAVYHSADLAATFNADQFTYQDGSGSLPPGTFDWQCISTAGSHTTVNLCEIGIGE